ncbi:MAG: FAD-dependent oxidoreductase [Spirochaetota bacterium]
MEVEEMKLMEPIKVGTMNLKNRIVYPPIENLFNNADGSVSDELLAYYKERAQGGAGLIIVQNSNVDGKASRSAICQLSIHNHHMIAGLNRLAETIKENGAHAMIQLGHGGRQTSPDSQPGIMDVAPSPIPSAAVGVVPRPLTRPEIVEIEDAFAAAAVRAQMAGFDGVEIHSAHGYLLYQFLSPLSNKRTDEYGGSFENRCRFALNIVHKVRNAVGKDFTVGFRFSGDEYVPGGVSAEEGVKYAKVIADTEMVDYIHVSAGTYESMPHLFPIMYYGHGHLRHLAEGVKKVVKNVPIISVGSYNPRTAEEALQEGAADLIAMGRAMIADPQLPNKVAAGNLKDVRPCIYGNEGCITRIFSWLPIRCEVNPEMGRERYWKKTPAAVKKKVMVVGGGMAGIEAARIAALRGHEVTLYEKSGALGGHLREASAPAFKETLRELKDWAIHQAEKGTFDVVMNTEVTEELVEQENPDALVLAVGSLPVMPEGNGCSDATEFRDVLLENVDVGGRAVIIGGGIVGCETALYLTEEKGKNAVVLEMQDDILIGMEGMNRQVLIERLHAAGVEIHTGMKVEEMDDNVVICTNEQGRHRFEGDTVIACSGLESDTGEVQRLEGIVDETYVVGDANRNYKIYNAFEDAHRAAMAI